MWDSERERERRGGDKDIESAGGGWSGVCTG